MGDTIRLIGPLGNGFAVIPGKKAFLVGGGIGVPPMLQLAKEINKNQLAPMQVIMGYRDDNTFLLDEFKEPDATIVAHRDIAYYRRIVGKIAIFSHMRGKSSDRFY